MKKTAKSKDGQKTKDQLIGELAKLRKRAASLEKSGKKLKHKQSEVEPLRKQIEFILGATKTGLDIIDSDFNIRYIDGEWAKVYGDPAGKKCYRYFMDRDDVCPGCGIIKALETKTVTVTEEVLPREGNRPIQVTTIPFQDNNGDWLVAEVNVDISERKRFERELQRARAELERQVEARTKDLVDTVKALQTEITGRKRADEAVQESEKYLKTMFDALHCGVVVINSETHEIVDTNSFASDMIGAPKEQIIGQVCHGFICPAERGKCPITDLKQTVDLSERILVKTGSERIPILKSVVPIMLKNRPHLIETFTDITKMKSAEQSLRESEERYRTLSETATEAIITINKEGNIVFWNKSAGEVYGYQADEVVGKNFRFLVPERLRADHQRAVSPTISTGKSNNIGKTLRGVGLRKNGMEFPTEFSIAHWEVREEPFFTIILRDITERQQGESQVMRQRAMLESINRVFREALVCETEEEVASSCLAVAEELTGSKFGFIGEVNKKGLFDTIAMSYPGWDACRMPDSDRIIMINDMEIRGIWGGVIREEQSLIVNNPASHPSRVGTPKGHPPLTSFLGVPLKLSGRTIGMIALANKESGYDLANQEAVEALSVAFVEALHRKRAEEILRESEERFRAMTESTSDAIVAADSQGKIIFWNSGAKNIFGYEEGEILGKPVHVLLPEHSRDADKKGMEEFLKTGASPFIGSVSESICRKKDGSEFPAGISRFSWKMSNQSFIGSIIRDITERKQKEEESRTILRTAMDGFWLTDTQGNFLEVNDAYCNLTGYSKDELLSMNIRDLEELETQEETARRILKIVQVGRDRFETRHKCKDGRIIDVEISVNCLETDGGRLFVFIRDITERKQAEEALRESEERFRSVVETAKEGIVNIDSGGNIISWNKAAEEMFGYSFDEIMGKPITILMPPRFFENYESRMDEVVSMEQSEILRRKAEVVGLRKDGTEFPVEHSLAYWETKNGIFYTTILHDITERKQADEALRESEERFRSIMENANDAIFFVDSRGIVRFWNRKAEELYGYTAEEVLGQPQSIVVPTRLREVHSKWMEKYLTGQVPEISGKIVEGIGERKDGRQFSVETSTALLKQGGETYLVAILRDSTERKKAEEEKARLEAQLRESHKMEAVGLLAGGIAHDFNNILTAIIGYASLLQMKMKEDDPLRPYLEQILTSSQRAASLTQSLLAFGRKQIINPRPVKANDIITKTEKLLVRLIGEDIDLKTTLTNEDTTVMADSGQIEQALMNFATNSRDAMPQGGHFMIETQRTFIDDDYVKTHGYGKPGEYVLISVSDSGTGMDEKTREKIFEPFFTTKEVGKGTGLGLAMVYGIVKQHNGYINCYSEPGKGTTFKIYLLKHREAVELQETMESAAAPIGGTETILVAEDDADARKTTRNILENFGYTILEAVDGEDAVRVFQGNRDTVKLLLLDVIMPKKNGKETYEEIRKLRPGMKALFISGYTANIIHKRGMLNQSLDFIMKPVSPTHLLKKVREVLNK